VLFGPNGLLDALDPGALHISMSTISVALSERLTAEHAKRGIDFVAAPVFGRPNIAAEGKLWIVAAGAEKAVERARPVFAPLARGVTVIGSEPRQAHAVKLGGNFLIFAMTHCLSEAFVYAQKQDVDPGAFSDAINSALFQSPLYAAYSKLLLHPPEHPGAFLDLALKDLGMLREAAAGRNTCVSLADTLFETLLEARRHGLTDLDWAVAQYRMAQDRGTLHQQLPPG
jgi:3-hydroxyisobutyrate dehydrogenase-like beta-hydroxyacid dehydrogenase